MTDLARTRTPARAGTPGRSSEHHVVVGLGFLSSLKNGDIDACVEMLHPEAEWHPSPKLLEAEVFRGREQVRHQIRSLHDRFDAELDITPEDGRQIGDHVLLIAVFKGINEITRREVTSRECWLITVRDDMWARIVVYPNAPAARLGFEEALRVAPVTIEVPTDPPLLPDELVVSDADDTDTAIEGREAITLVFTIDEAAALNRWLSQPAEDGELAAYDTAAWPGLMKIRTAVEHAQALGDIREALVQVGVEIEGLSDEQVARLAQAIAPSGRKFDPTT